MKFRPKLIEPFELLMVLFVIALTMISSINITDTGNIIWLIPMEIALIIAMIHGIWVIKLKMFNYTKRQTRLASVMAIILIILLHLTLWLGVDWR